MTFPVSSPLIVLTEVTVASSEILRAPVPLCCLYDVRHELPPSKSTSICQWILGDRPVPFSSLPPGSNGLVSHSGKFPTPIYRRDEWIGCQSH